jgi:hypothetical protein
VLIDGQGAPDKGLLADFGDTDAQLTHTHDGEQLAYAEAHQSYQQSTIERSVAFVRRRYFVVADRVLGGNGSAREHRWRLGGWAGFDSGGHFEPRNCQNGNGCGARWERSHGGVDVHLAATSAGLVVEEPPHMPLLPPHVGAFDRKRTVEDHGVIDGVVNAAAPGYLAVLAPYRVGAAPDDEHAALRVAAVDAGADAAAWLVESAEGRELVWLRGADASDQLALPDGGNVASDAALVLVDMAGAFGLIGRGSYASLNGSTVVNEEASDGVAVAP